MGQKLTDRTALTSIATGDLLHVVDISDTTDSAEGTSKKITQDNLIPDSSATVKGKVELATSAETITGTDTVRAVTPAGAAAAYQPLDADLTALAAHPTYNLSLNIAPLFAPQGFLINGKIVPSVGSNNLTVALKTLAGTDPSATDPIYIRIGDTVRTLTAALSVTMNAGTNWFNAGSAELATKEIDYFVSLLWGSSASNIVMGISRKCSYTQWADVTDSNTDEKNWEYSTNASALANTDNIEYIGRFAATLSAGAGYTWTVPTFTPINLIQRPIYETRWMDWTPTITVPAGTSPTYTANFINKYRIAGSKIDIVTTWNNSSGGTAGAGTNRIQFTTPFTNINQVNDRSMPWSGWAQESGGTACALIGFETTARTVDLYTATAVSFVGNDQSSGSRSIAGVGFYEI